VLSGKTNYQTPVTDAVAVISDALDSLKISGEPVRQKNDGCAYFRND